jgi:hypothetical protein
MAIAKQAFYEGAALHLVARTEDVLSIRYETPFFVFNDRLLALLKYSTRSRSPWGFTFTGDEQDLLRRKAFEHRIVLGLVCGADGVAALPYEAYTQVVPLSKSAIHISCYRQYGEYYGISGPMGTLDTKVPPSAWQNILRL